MIIDKNLIKNQKLLRIIWNKFWAKKNFWPPWGQGLSLWWGHACQRLSPRGQFWPWYQKITFLFKIFWNAFQKILSKIWFYQNLSFIVINLAGNNLSCFLVLSREIYQPCPPLLQTHQYKPITGLLFSCHLPKLSLIFNINWIHSSMSACGTSLMSISWRLKTPSVPLKKAKHNY